MIITDGPDGVQLLAARERLRMGHVLTAPELQTVNQVLADHGVPTFDETVIVAMVIERVRWLETHWRAHVMAELVTALMACGPQANGPDGEFSCLAAFGALPACTFGWQYTPCGQSAKSRDRSTETSEQGGQHQKGGPGG